MSFVSEFDIIAMMSKFCHYQEDKTLKKYRRIMTGVLVMMLAASLVAGCSKKEEEPVQLVLDLKPLEYFFHHKTL